MAEIPDQPNDTLQLARSLARALQGGCEQDAVATIADLAGLYGNILRREIGCLTRKLHDPLRHQAPNLANRWAEWSANASPAVRTG